MDDKKELARKTALEAQARLIVEHLRENGFKEANFSTRPAAYAYPDITLGPGNHIRVEFHEIYKLTYAWRATVEHYSIRVGNYGDFIYYKQHKDGKLDYAAVAKTAAAKDAVYQATLVLEAEIETRVKKNEAIVDALREEFNIQKETGSIRLMPSICVDGAVDIKISFLTLDQEKARALLAAAKAVTNV